MQELNKEFVAQKLSSNFTMQELTSEDLKDVNGGYLDYVWDAGVAVGEWLASFF